MTSTCTCVSWCINLEFTAFEQNVNLKLIDKHVFKLSRPAIKFYLMRGFQLLEISHRSWSVVPQGCDPCEWMSYPLWGLKINFFEYSRRKRQPTRKAASSEILVKYLIENKRIYKRAILSAPYFNNDKYYLALLFSFSLQNFYPFFCR